jgi:hypothetical protein
MIYKCTLWQDLYIEEINDCLHYEKEIEIPFIPQIGMYINNNKINNISYNTEKNNFYCFSGFENLKYKNQISYFVNDTWKLKYKYSDLRCK